MNEQELRAWSLAIAAIMLGGIDKSNSNTAIEKYTDLAGDIAAYIKQAAPPLGNDSRFKQPPHTG